LPVFAGSGAEEGFDEVATRDLVFVERAAGYVGFEVVAELGGDQVSEHVGVVVDGGDGDVYLRRPIGFVSAWRAVYELELLDQIPPERVQIFALGVGVQKPLEVEDDEGPEGEDEPVGPAPGGEPLRGEMFLWDSGDLF
jgi:hypothetical protein